MTEGGTLVIVHAANTPPLSFKGLNSSPKGLVFDFWKAWSARTGVRVTFVQSGWPETLRMVREGKADIHGGLYRTEERDRYLDFTEPLFTQKGTLFARASLNAHSIDDLEGGRVAVLDEGFSEYWMASHHPHIARKAYATSREMVEGALTGEVDALLTEHATLIHQLGTFGRVKDFVPVQDMYERSIRGAVAAGRKDLLDLVESGIRSMGEEQREQIYERWIITDDSFPDWVLPCAAIVGAFLVLGLAGVTMGWNRSD